MTLMKSVKGTIAVASVVLSMCFGNAALAQQAPAQGNKEAQPELKTEDISDNDLRQFVQASAKAAAVQEESQKAMVAVVEEEKLSVEKFTEMAKAHQQQKLDSVPATAEEKAAFNKAAQRIMAMQPQIEQNMQQAIEKEGISLGKFEQIMLAYQQNAAIQARVQKMLEEKP
jgi:nucleoid-associated protein YgaU